MLEKESKVCNRCGMRGLHWEEEDGKFWLHDDSGNKHRCGSGRSSSKPKTNSEPKEPVEEISSDPELIRIRGALERIAGALEKMVKESV